MELIKPIATLDLRKSHIYPRLPIIIPKLKQSTSNLRSHRGINEQIKSNQLDSIVTHCKRTLNSKAEKGAQLDQIISKLWEAIVNTTDFNAIYSLKMSMIDVLLSFGDYHRALEVISVLVVI